MIQHSTREALRLTFLNACSSYSGNVNFHHELWNKIQQAYLGTQRYYHNLLHLSSMFQVLRENRKDIEHWNDVRIALFYHDFIYDVKAGDNEEQSADRAKADLSLLGAPADVISRIAELILLTKHHQQSTIYEQNLFIDADLAVLGADGRTYGDYLSAIRKEYSCYSDSIFIAGRIKLVKHFLAMPCIYKTGPCRDALEESARENLQRELLALEGISSWSGIKFPFT